MLLPMNVFFFKSETGVKYNVYLASTVDTDGLVL